MHAKNAKIFKLINVRHHVNSVKEEEKWLRQAVVEQAFNSRTPEVEAGGYRETLPQKTKKKKKPKNPRNHNDHSFRTMITPLSWKMSPTDQTPQNNFEVANWGDPASQTILARTWDKSCTFPLSRDWTKNDKAGSALPGLDNPNFSFQDPLKMMVPPGSRK